MHFAKLHKTRRVVLFLTEVGVSLLILLHAACAQESANQGIPRTDRPEISVAVRDQSGAMITAAGTVKLYRDGMPAGSAGLSRGRTFFGSIGFGSYSLLSKLLAINLRRGK